MRPFYNAALHIFNSRSVTPSQVSLTVLLLPFFRFDELAASEGVEFLAGGATQNAMKVAQVSDPSWL